MPKVALKKIIAAKQNGTCALTGETLPSETRFFDTDRITQKKDGGIYRRKNTRVVMPIAHMERHGTLRIRELLLEQLKAAIDHRVQICKFYYKINNQMLAYHRRTDYQTVETMEWLETKEIELQPDVRRVDRMVQSLMKQMKEYDPLAKAALGVRGVGPITVAYCLVYINLAIADHASSLWKYAGIHIPSHLRFKTVEADGKVHPGNKNLRTALYTMADSQWRVNGAYRPIAEQVKARLERSDREVDSRNTQGDLVRVPWKETKPCHRHGAGYRAIMKHFLADYWFVGRTLAGLPTNPIYAEAVLGNGHKTIDPRTRGWKF